MIYRLKFLLIIPVLALFCCKRGAGTKEHDGHQHPEAQTEAEQPLSPLKTAMAMIGNNHVHLEYSAPGVRGRAIWGELVPYNKIWVTGAHMATTIQFNEDLVIGGNTIPAGKYALFTIPGEQEWTVIINKTWDQHQADIYNISEDVARFNVTPEKLAESTEQLTFEVIPAGEKKGEIVMQWEKLRISFGIESLE